jgi:hypothetical protein
MRLNIFQRLILFIAICGMGMTLLVMANTTLHIYAQADSPTVTLPPTNTPHPMPTDAPTETPIPTLTPIPVRLCSDCKRVRLRSAPGTAGDVLLFLDETSEMLLSGRSDDALWVQVTVTNQNNTTGWVAAQYIRNPNQTPIDPQILQTLPVIGTTVNLPPTSTLAFGNLPFLSGLSSHVSDIYLKGLSLGNHPNAFSKVGDSITASPYFLTPLGAGNYRLEQYSDLSGAVTFFSGSFAAASVAAVPGWTADKVLNPDYANKGICGTDTPLICEYKRTRPAIAIIMFGTNDSGSGTTGPFENYMRQILQTTIDMGIVPVLSTIPPKPINQDQDVRVNLFNTSIRSLAAQYQIPLIDYYSTMVNLPNQGISSDKLHPSFPPGGATCVFTSDNLQYGYTMRNLITLQAINAIWQLYMH